MGEQVIDLTHILPVLHFVPPESVRKPKVFWRFLGVQKCNIGSVHFTIKRKITLIKMGTIFRGDTRNWDTKNIL